MMPLPKKIGPFTLMRRLGSDGVTESFVGILDEPAGKQVVVHRLLPWLLRDPTRLVAVEQRIQDLTAIRHPVLAPVLDLVTARSPDTNTDDRFILEEWVDAVDLDRVIAWCRENKKAIPHNIYLHLATQVCNGLEALHGRPGKASGADNVLHLALQPASILLTSDGKVLLGGYGLVRSPTSLPNTGTTNEPTADQGGQMRTPPRMEYLSPEQTHPDQKLGPSSDIFALGALLYELLTLESLFRAERDLQTVHRVRRAEVTTPLLRVKEILPGLDKVLYRALSLNPRHRYQRAFVLREDLRGLMSGYSFQRIAEETREFIAPMFDQRAKAPAPRPEPLEPTRTGSPEATELSTSSMLAGVEAPPPRPPLQVAPVGEPTTDDTAALIRRAQEKAGLPVASGPSTLVPAEADLPKEEVTETDPHALPPPEPVLSRSTPPPAPNATWTQRSAVFEEPNTSWTQTPGTPAAQKAATPAPPPPAAPPKPPAPAAAKPAAPPTMPLELEEPKAARSVPAPAAAPAPAVHRAVTIDDEAPPVRSGLSPVLYVIGGLGASAILLGGILVCAGGGLGGLAFLQTSSDGPVMAAGTAPDAVAPPTPAPAPEPPPSEEPAPAPPSPGTSTFTGTGSADPVPAPEPRPATSPSTSPAPKSDPPPTSPKVDRSPPPPADPPPVRSTPPSSGTSDFEAEEYPRTAPSRQPDTTSRSTGTIDLAPPPPLEPGPTPAELDATLAVAAPGDLASYSQRAHEGALTETDRAALEAIAKTDPGYTRARVLLYEDAKARRDVRARQDYLEDIMSIPENRYDPTLLVEDGELAILRRDWRTAVDRANAAERQWQRLPSDILFSRKAMIYELQAAGWQGVFYESGGEDLDALQNAIRSWEKYRRHAETKSRSDMSTKADEQLAKLQDMQRRLE